MTLSPTNKHKFDQKVPIFVKYSLFRKAVKITLPLFKQRSDYIMVIKHNSNMKSKFKNLRNENRLCSTNRKTALQLAVLWSVEKCFNFWSDNFLIWMKFFSSFLFVSILELKSDVTHMHIGNISLYTVFVSNRLIS